MLLIVVVVVGLVFNLLIALVHYIYHTKMPASGKMLKVLSSYITLSLSLSLSSSLSSPSSLLIIIIIARRISSMPGTESWA